tara:strand:- start:120 stop:320 length:201 start_codon:yes stop_codon:yes gene_type:complete
MYQVEFERTLFGNLYNEYRRKDLPDNVTDLVAIKKADKAFTDILGDEDYLNGKIVNLSKIEEKYDD